MKDTEPSGSDHSRIHFAVKVSLNVIEISYSHSQTFELRHVIFSKNLLVILSCPHALCC
jgi:hypothetical protein